MSCKCAHFGEGVGLQGACFGLVQLVRLQRAPVAKWIKRDRPKV